MTMNDFYKDEDKITTQALVDLRKQKDKSLLNNKNVDCYVLGYKQAQSSFIEWLKGFTDEDNKSRLETLYQFCIDKQKAIEYDLGMSGYMYSMPDSAAAMLKLLSQMQQNIAFVLKHLEDIKLTYSDYGAALKTREE